MSVLAREVDAYQRALEAYQRRVNSYNRSVDRYKDTLVRDMNGRLLVINGNGDISAVDDEGKVISAALGPDFSPADYGSTTIPDSAFYSLLRQNPTGSQRETRNDVQRYYDGETGQEFYYYYGTEGGDGGGQQVKLGPEWTIGDKIPGFSSGDSYGPDLYSASRDVSTYPDSPPEWTEEFNKKAPELTKAQSRRANSPSLADIETGLIGQVMKGSGVRYGVPVYTPRNK